MTDINISLIGARGNLSAANPSYFNAFQGQEVSLQTVPGLPLDRDPNPVSVFSAADPTSASFTLEADWPPPLQPPAGLSSEELLALINAWFANAQSSIVTNLTITAATSLDLSDFGILEIELSPRLGVTVAQLGTLNLRQITELGSVTIDDNSTAEFSALTGGPDDDSIFGRGGRDFVEGLGGDDLITTGRGQDTIRGGDGNDVINAGAGRDELFGGDGLDVLIGGKGNDTIRGGNGNDEVVGGKGRDDIEGGTGDDILDGRGWKDFVDGDGGNDTIRLGGGGDVGTGGLGRDTIFGGNGADDISGGSQRDRLFGGKGADTLEGNGGRDVLKGGRGADDLAGGRNADRLFGGGGDDTLKGGGGNDQIRAGFGDDVIMGGKGDDEIFAFDGDDDVQAGRGDDRIDPGRGTDLLTGNAGADTFVFDTVTATGRDTITDFRPEEGDILDLTALRGDTPFTLFAKIEEAPGGLEVSLNGQFIFLQFLSIDDADAVRGAITYDGA